MTSISMRIPVDLLEKLKRIARLKEMAGYQSLIKYYVGQGLLRDADLVRQIEEEENARIGTAEVEAAFEKIGLDQGKIDAFWASLGHPPRRKSAGA